MQYQRKFGFLSLRVVPLGDPLELNELQDLVEDLGDAFGATLSCTLLTAVARGTAAFRSSVRVLASKASVSREWTAPMKFPDT